MTDPEIEELAGLWQEQEPAETARFEAMARRARRRGRLLGYADLALAALIVGGTIFGIFVTPRPTTIAIALLLILATIWLTLKRRGLREMASTLNTSDPTAFLESSARYAAAALRRANLSLMLIPLFMVAAILFKASLRGGDFDQMLQAVWTWASSLRGTIALAIAILVMAAMGRSRIRLQEELRRLERMRLEYEEENRTD